MSYLAEYGPRLLERGYNIVPIQPGTKACFIDNWQDTQTTPELLAKWIDDGLGDYGIGVLGGDVAIVDNDILDKPMAKLIADHVIKAHGRAPVRIGQKPKHALFFKCSTPFAKLSSKLYHCAAGKPQRVEILVKGQQAVAYATHPDTNEPYYYANKRGLLEVPRDELPELTQFKALAIIEKFEAEAAKRGWTEVQAGSTTQPNVDPKSLEHIKPPLDISSAQVAEALVKVPCSKMDYHGWVMVGQALHHQYSGGSEGLFHWDKWSELDSARYSDFSAVADKYETFTDMKPGRKPVTFATVLKMAADTETALPPPVPAGEVRARLLPYDAIMAGLKPIDWLVEGYIETDSWGVWFGETGSYKSFMAIDLMHCVALGRPWHGAAVKQGAVVYVAGEGNNAIARRFAAWKGLHGAEGDAPPILTTAKGEDFSSPANVDSLCDEIEAQCAALGEPPAMVVIDTLARNFGAGDENNTADMNKFVNTVDSRVRARFGCVVLIVHHTGLMNKDRARGSGSLKNGADFEARIERQPELSHAVFTPLKNKDAEVLPPVWFEPVAVPVLLPGADMETFSGLALQRCKKPVRVEEDKYPDLMAVFYELLDENDLVVRLEACSLAIERGLVKDRKSFNARLAELDEIGQIYRLPDNKHIRILARVEGE